jgi:dTDP-4-dehydrorhamnose reductase
MTRPVTDLSATGPVLLLGAGGMLGRAWRELLAGRGIGVTAVGRAECDLADPSAPARVIADRFATVINCAAYTAVDAAETEPAAAHEINAAAVGRIAARCRDTGARLVHYSTDYVFPGTTAVAYKTDDPTDPVNEYGLSKLAGERLVRESGCRHLIVRTSRLYAPWGKNFVRTIAAAARTKASLKVVDDQTGRPTSAEGLADATLRLLAAGAEGTHHVCDSGRCTWYEFAVEIAAFAGPACVVQPCGTADFPRPARRPPFSVLDLTATEDLIGPLRPWKDNLADVLRRME